MNTKPINEDKFYSCCFRLEKADILKLDSEDNGPINVSARRTTSMNFSVMSLVLRHEYTRKESEDVFLGRGLESERINTESFQFIARD